MIDKIIIPILLKTKWGKAIEERVEKGAVQKILRNSDKAHEEENSILKQNHAQELKDVRYYYELELEKKDRDKDLLIERIEQRVSIKENELEKQKVKLIGLQDQARKTENTYVEYILEMKQLEYELKSLFGLIQPIVQLGAKFQKFFEDKESNSKQKAIDEQMRKLGLSNDKVD